MQDKLLWLQALSIVSFAFYGCACIFSESLVKEFERYGLPKFRVLTGVLELLGSLGLLLGIFYPPLSFFASFGLAALMVCGLATRIKIRDSLAQTLPAVFFLCLNSLIAYLSMGFL